MRISVPYSSGGDQPGIVEANIWLRLDERISHEWATGANRPDFLAQVVYDFGLKNEAPAKTSNKTLLILLGALERRMSNGLRVPVRLTDRVFQQARDNQDGCVDWKDKFWQEDIALVKAVKARPLLRGMSFCLDTKPGSSGFMEVSLEQWWTFSLYTLKLADDILKRWDDIPSLD